MRARLFLNKYYHSFCDPAIFLLTILLQTRESQKYIFSVTRRSRSDSGLTDLLTYSLTDH